MVALSSEPAPSCEEPLLGRLHRLVRLPQHVRLSQIVRLPKIVRLPHLVRLPQLVGLHHLMTQPHVGSQPWFILASTHSAVITGVPHSWLNGSAGVPPVPATISVSAPTKVVLSCFGLLSQANHNLNLTQLQPELG
jgi:hypothetical protein